MQKETAKDGMLIVPAEEIPTDLRQSNQCLECTGPACHLHGENIEELDM